MEALIDEKTTGNSDLEQALKNNLDETKLKSIKSNGNVAKIEYGNNEYIVDLKSGNTNKNSQEVDKWDGVSKSEGLVGKGTNEEPYLIRSGADLFYLSRQTCDYNNTITGLNEDETLNGCNLNALSSVYKLTKNISLENHPFIPIGVYYDTNDNYLRRNYFSGTFDGNNYEITKVKIYSSDIKNTFSVNQEASIGLFGDLNKATIKNLMLTDIDYKGTGYMGGIAGNTYPYTNSPITTISNCYVSGNIQCTDVSFDAHSNSIGGLIGQHYNSIIIDNCTVDAYLKGRTYVGGLIGDCRVYSSYTAKISNCTVNGKIEGHQGTGGLFGLLAGTEVENCVNNATISNVELASNDYQPEVRYTGGLVGYNEVSSVIAKINNSYNTGDITINNQATMIGGLGGYITGVDFNNCYNTGNINCRGDVKSLGGLLGGFYANISECKNCYNRGNVIVDSTKSITEFGKLVGRLNNPPENFELENCQNYGETLATEDYGIRKQW